MTELKETQEKFKCSCCKCNLAPESFDTKKKGQRKATCRKCLSKFQARYVSHSVLTEEKNTIRLRHDLIAAIAELKDPKEIAQVIVFVRNLNPANAQSEIVMVTQKIASVSPLQFCDNQSRVNEGGTSSYETRPTELQTSHPLA